jgi:antitoxin ParD1/3/4
MQVSLTPELEELVRRKLESGLHGDASEVVREALRLLATRDELADSSWSGCAPH